MEAFRLRHYGAKGLKNSVDNVASELAEWRANARSMSDQVRAGGKKAMQKLDRSAPLPEAMQGRWITKDDQEEIKIAGSEIFGFGSVVEYDWKTIEEVDGAVVVDWGVNDASMEGEDAIARRHITNRVITSEGEFHIDNVKFAAQLERRD